ncbi:MAG: hypothetical protein HeimC2_03060 [Candidatus Heimdallarchaeota archaeon LC_2]|nr:MAG: hypothetical protein HeimC2_03060 [Candidatus Heimdallarchaeota archaeon LC_2]
MRIVGLSAKPISSVITAAGAPCPLKSSAAIPITVASTLVLSSFKSLNRSVTAS